MPETDPEVPHWLAIGSAAVHDTFGTGTVVWIGHYRGVPTVSLDFDSGAKKALAIEYGLPHLSPLTVREVRRRRRRDNDRGR